MIAREKITNNNDNISAKINPCFCKIETTKNVNDAIKTVIGVISPSSSVCPIELVIVINQITVTGIER